MSCLIIKRRQEDLDVADYSDKEMQTLGDFLIHDLRDDLEGVLEWFYEPEKHGCIGEAFYEEHVGNNIKIVADYFGTPDFIVSQKNFLKIVHEWCTIYKKKPQFVKITQDGNEFKFEARY